MDFDRSLPSAAEIRSLSQRELLGLVRDRLEQFGEEEAMAVLTSRFCSSELCQRIAQTPRLTSFYGVRLRLVTHQLTPRAHALKFIHYLYWADLLSCSTNVRVPPAVRGAIDHQLQQRVRKMSIGEKVATARICSRELARSMLGDPDTKVFTALLTNPQLAEHDLLSAIINRQCRPNQLRAIADDRRWSHRAAIRRALVENPETPRAVAASQLRHLSPGVLGELLADPATSLYLRRCIERVQTGSGELDGFGT